MLVDLSFIDPGRAYADKILSQLILNHGYPEWLQVSLRSQSVDLLGHGQGLRRDDNKIKVFIDGGAALIVDLYDVGMLDAKAPLHDRPQILLPDIKIPYGSGSALSGHLVGGETNYYLALAPQIIGTPQQGDMPIMNGIEGSSYCNSGHQAR